MSKYDDEFVAKFEFGVSQNDLKARKWKLSNNDLNFIALQNAYMYDELRGENRNHYGPILGVIFILLGFQTFLLYLLAVKLGAIQSLAG